MTAAADLLASGLWSLRRVGLLLVAAGVALVLLLAAHPAAPGAHRIDGGPGLRLATTTAPAAPAP
jgi:hypothetical protein